MRRAPLAALLLACLLAGSAAAEESAELEERPFVRGFRVSGNSVLPGSEIQAALAPFTGRRLSAEDLMAARDALTRLYVDHGYATSGAFLPDQRVSDGIVELRVEEGRLEDVLVTGTRHLRAKQLRARVLRAADGPLQVQRLRETLQELQEGPLLDQVSATLTPGSRPGLARLELAVREPGQTTLALSADNWQSPSVGAEGAQLRALHHNLLGLGDGLELATGTTRGMRSYESRYWLPLGARETQLELSYRASRADVVEDPFDDLDIASRWRAVGAGLRHPLRLSSDSLLWLGLQAELVRSRTYLEDQRFGFAPGTEHGEARITALRATQEWLQRDLDDVLAARSTLSFGLDAFDASNAPGHGLPDGTFFAWLGQVQWAHRFADWLGGAKLGARADVQLTPDPLLPPELFPLGGAFSVRGYRENQLVRDNALVGSLELRIPLLRAPDGTERLQLATFLDVGHGWNRESTPGPKTLAAVGLGLRLHLGASGLAALYWGQPLRHVHTLGDDWLQNHGLHLSVSFETTR
jgi:hemolysin activation/secretion protein